MKKLFIALALLFCMEACYSQKNTHVSKPDKEIVVKDKKRVKKEITATTIVFALFIIISLRMIGTPNI